MIIVSDTSAITSLLQINRAELLIRLYERVIIPPAVQQELLRTHSTLPSYLEVATVRDLECVSRLSATLDPGEAEAIVLMLEGHGDLLLIDERLGRSVARREGVPVIGLVGVLVEARKRGVTDSLASLLDQLQTTAGFRISAALRERALSEVGESDI